MPPKAPLINFWSAIKGRRPNGFLGLYLNDRTIIILVILLDKTVSVGEDSLCIRRLVSESAYKVCFL